MNILNNKLFIEGKIYIIILKKKYYYIHEQSAFPNAEVKKTNVKYVLKTS